MPPSYNHALMAVHQAQLQLEALGVPHRRPDDYFAEMVKTDSHMARVKTKLIKQQTDAKESEERRNARDNKKFGKQFQVAKTQERAQKRKASMDAIKGLKKGRPNSIGGAGGDGPGFKRQRTDGGDHEDGGGSRFKPGSRDAKESRFKRTHADKRNTRESSTDGSGFNAGKWSVGGGGKKGSPGKKGGAQQRPGKARRQQSKRS
jgi:rRNA-processing protein EBP2